jgi:EAL domain-containing protein (putative c-di-GMP-specific phosphodiesterase class I)/PAS domain-containing protein
LTNKQFPQELLDGIPDAMLIVDAKGVGLFANKAATDLFGFDVVGQQVGVPFRDFAVVQVPRNDGLRVVELRVANASEWVKDSVAVVLRDVTEREKLKRDLQVQVSELKGLADLLEVIPVPVVRTNSVGNIAWANGNFTKTFGTLGDLGEVPALAGDKGKLTSLFHEIANSRKSNKSDNITSVVFEPKFENGAPLLVQAVPLSAQTSKPETKREFAVILNTTLESQDLLSTYMNLVFYDADLGVPNRRGLTMQAQDDWADTNLEQALLVVKAAGLDSIDQELVANRVVLLLKREWLELIKSHQDLPDLKDKVVMRVGRVAGDSISCVIASTRNSDVGAAALSDLLARSASEKSKDRAHIGLVLDTRSAANLEQAIEEGVIAAQEAADSGKNIHVLTEDFNQIIENRRLTAEAVRNAVTAKSFTIALQPRVDLQTGEVVAAEILARLHDEKLGDISPEIFVPLLRRFNLVSELTQLVGEKSIELIQQWKTRKREAITLSLNISPGDMSNARALSVLRSLARQFAEGTALELEMSEMDQFPIESHASLKALLLNLGVELSLDDFGKGYSSFSYLVSLPISVIKVDKSFADGLLSDTKPASIALFRSIVALARELKISVCAEGVETAEQVEELKMLGIDQIQGYFYSKPLSAVDFEAKYLA